MEQNYVEGKLSIGFMAKMLIFSYIITFSCLLPLAYVQYKYSLGVGMISIVIIVIYLLSTLVAGFLAGKKAKKRKFIWGFLVGLVYFLVLVVMSLMVNRELSIMGNSFFTTFIICVGGGMLGGMLS